MLTEVTNKILKLFFLTFCILQVSSSASFAQQTDIDLANQYVSTNEYDKAVVYFEKAYDRDPFGTYKPFLKCLIYLKDYDKAEKLVKKQIKKAVGNSAFLVDMGNLYDIQNKHDDALKQYDKAVKTVLPDVNSVIVLANAFIEIQQVDYAIKTYEEGRKITRGAYPFSFELAEMYAQKGDLQKMINEYLDLISTSETYLPNVQAILQNKILNDLNGVVSEQVRMALLRRIQKSGESTVYNEMLYWLLLQEKDFDSAFIQAKSIDKKTTDDGNRVYALGQLAVSNKDYAVGEKCFQYVVDKGTANALYISAKTQMVMALAQKTLGNNTFTKEDLAKLEKGYESVIAELGKNSYTAQLISSFAHLKAFYLAKTEDAVSLLEETIDLPNIQPQFKAECKLELADIYVFQGNVWDASLLYSQVDKDFKHDEIGREAKYRNARLSYYLGEFEWAKAQLNVLKEATSQLISNDAMSLALLIQDNSGLDGDSSTDALLMYSRADLLCFQNRDDDALKTLDSLLEKFPSHSLTDEVWFRKAMIYDKKGDLTQEATFLADITEKYPDDILADDALYKLALLNENKLNNKEKAKELFQKMIEKYPGSSFTVDARKHFRALRGDKIN